MAFDRKNFYLIFLKCFCRSASLSEIDARSNQQSSNWISLGLILIPEFRNSGMRFDREPIS